MASSATAATTFQGTAVMPRSGTLMLTWRCLGCPKVILTFYDYGGDYREHRCACKTWNILPRDQRRLIREVPRHRPTN
jgi:hypothetical protein